MRYEIKYMALITVVMFILLSACAGPTTTRPEISDAAVELEAEKQRVFALQEAINNQQRLYKVAWPVLKSGSPLCTDRHRQDPGIKYANKYDVPDEMHDAAVSLFDMGENLQVIAVADDSPAAEAGIQEGDVIISVNGESAPVGKKASKEMYELMKKHTKDATSINLVMHQEGISKTLSVSTVEICDYPTLIVENDAVNAMANGNQILIFQGMMDFTRSDHELSFVVAHELAHNNMRHIEAQKTNYFIGFLFDILVIGLTGVDVGIRNATAKAYSKEFEAEADYVGTYIIARKGDVTDDAPAFWRRMGTKHPGSIQQNHAASHPSTPERFVALEETIKEIKLKQETDQELMPNIDEDARSNRDPPPSQAPIL